MTETSHPALTDPQKRALVLIGEGLSIEEMAERLGTTPRTAKYYVDLLRGKFGVKTKRELIPYAREMEQ